MSERDQHAANRAVDEAGSADPAGGGAGGAVSRNVAKCRDVSQPGEKRETKPIAGPAPGVSRNVAECRDSSQGREKRKANPNGLTPRQRAALAWLIEGATVSAVADRLGVERRTVGRWKKHPRFVAEVDRLCAATLARAPAGALAQRVRATRVTPLSKIRRRNAELFEELEATRPKKWIWMGVEYPTFDDYFAAIHASDARRGR